MFSKIYLHRATRSIEVMLCDVMAEADAAWGGWLRNSITDPAVYRTLTDNYVMGRIEVRGRRARVRGREEGTAV
jgi:hypothetical protein